jgi:hypothetical protein
MSVSAYATDWRLFSIDQDKDEMMFYAASDQIREGDHVRMWVETLSAKDVFSLDANTHPEAAQKVTARLKAGYRPPTAVLLGLTPEQAAIMALAEEVADEQASPTLQLILFEFDCTGARYRILDSCCCGRVSCRASE